MTAGFGFVDELVPGVRWDAKYATWDNFTGKPVDGYEANRIVGSSALCAALARARDEAASRGFGLLLWDGYRPQRAVDCFLRWVAQPEDGRTKRRHCFRAYAREWWHYTLTAEPHPATYFDFPVAHALLRR